MRIVSLLASSTEIVSALGYEGHLVGRSHECDYPRSVERLPVCSEPKVKSKDSNQILNRQVTDIVRESLSVYRIDIDRLKELRPDIIITQDQRESCEVSLEDVEQATCEWLEYKPKIVSLKANALADVWSVIHNVAEALGDPVKGDILIKRYKERMTDISDKAFQLNGSPRVACLEWFDPLMGAGNWIAELVDLLDSENLFGELGKNAPYVDWEDIREKDPDLIIALPRGWGIDHNREEIYNLTLKPGWGELKAVREGKVYLTDGNQYFNRPGPRLVESLEILAEIMYPDEFQFGHEGRDWQVL